MTTGPPVEFWAARAALRLQQPEAYLSWLHRASWAGDTFYGMLAGRLLGQGFEPTGIAATLTEADITAVDSTPNGHLAFALLQVGQTEQAALALACALAGYPEQRGSRARGHGRRRTGRASGCDDRDCRHLAEPGG